CGAVQVHYFLGVRAFTDGAAAPSPNAWFCRHRTLFVSPAGADPRRSRCVIEKGVLSPPLRPSVRRWLMRTAAAPWRHCGLLLSWLPQNAALVPPRMQPLAWGAARFALGAPHQKLRGRKKEHTMNSQIITAESTSTFQPQPGSPIPAETTGGAPYGETRGAEKKSKTQILCEEAIQRLADALASGQSDAIKTYLGVMARFHHYSFCNQLLILAQRPESTHVAGYQRWQALGRQVRKDEKAIHILAPLMKKRQEPEDGQDGSSQ